jgi:hypothetical protein
MQKIPWILVALLLGACATTQPSPSSDPDEVAIRAARGRLNEALARQQFTAMREELVDNVSITGPVWRTVDRDQLLQAYTRLTSRRPDLVWIANRRLSVSMRADCLPPQAASGANRGVREAFLQSCAAPTSRSGAKLKVAGCSTPKCSSLYPVWEAATVTHDGR